MAFHHLNYPHSWKNEYSRYPQGLSILESLTQWVHQVDEMVDTMNLTTEQVAAIQLYVDTEIPKVMNSVLPANLNTVLTGWLQTGYLYTALNDMLVARFGSDITLLKSQMGKKIGDGVVASMADLGQDIKTAMTGGSVAVVGVGSTGTVNIVDKAVTVAKAADDFVIATENNLLDPAGFTVGGYYDKDNVWTVSTMHQSSNIIPCKPGDVFRRNTSSGQFIMVDKKGNYIAGADQAADTVVISQNYFIRGFRVVVQTNPGVTGGAYVVKGTVLNKKTHKFASSFTRVLAPDEIENIAKTTNDNLHTTTDNTSGGYYDAVSGKWMASTAVNTGPFIPVSNGELIAKMTGSGQYSYWNNRKQWIGGVDGLGTATIIKVPNVSEIQYLRTNNDVTLLGKYVKRISAASLTKYTLDKDKYIIPAAAVDAFETLPVKNLLVYDDAEINKYYQYNTGTPVNSQFITASAAYPVTPGEKMYSDTGSGQKTYWDANNNYVTGQDIAGAFTVPLTSTIKTIRVNMDAAYLNSGKAILVRGEDIPVEKYRLPSNRFVIGENEPGAYIKPFERVKNPIITKAMVTDRTATSVADPFIVNDNGRYHMFFEVIQAAAEEIGHAYSDDLIDWTYTGIVLPQTGYHRSAYPHVFKHEGMYYMTPDTGAQLNLYRTNELPGGWELVNDTLVEGYGFNDTNIFFVADNWYMTTSQNGGGIDLYINTSGDFTNSSWTFVSKIIENTADLSSLRGAGNPNVYDGYVIMPVQVTAEGQYGKYTKLYKLSNFGKDSFAAADIGVLVKNQDNGMWNATSMHHVSNAPYLYGKRIFAADGTRANGEYSIGLYQEA